MSKNFILLTKSFILTDLVSLKFKLTRSQPVMLAQLEEAGECRPKVSEPGKAPTGKIVGLPTFPIGRSGWVDLLPLGNGARPER